MKYAGSILLIVLGLILALALNVDVSGMNLNLIGWILAIAGIVGLIITIGWDIAASSKKNEATPTE